MRDPMNDNNKTANHSDNPSVDNGSAPLIKQSRTEVYRPNKPEIVYNTLLDDSPLGITKPQPVKVTDNVSISAEPIDQAVIDHTQQDTIKENTIADDDVTQTDVLTRTHKSEALTDTHILRESHQLQPTDDRLEDDNNATGHMIEHLGVATKQWHLTLNWQRTNVPKSGFINKLKNRTEVLDLDLTCLLCNRYGEVLEQVWFKNMRDQSESVRHHGDELLGTRPELPDNIDPSGDSEAQTALHDRQANQEHISFYLGRIPTHIFHVVMLVSSYQGAALADAQQGLCQLTDDEGNVINEVNLATLPKDCAALWLATLTRSGDSWRYNADMSPLTGHVHDSLVKQVHEHLVRTAK